MGKRGGIDNSERSLLLRCNDRLCFQPFCGCDEIVPGVSRCGAGPLWYLVDDGPIAKDETRPFFLVDTFNPLPDDGLNREAIASTHSSDITFHKPRYPKSVLDVQRLHGLNQCASPLLKWLDRKNHI